MSESDTVNLLAILEACGKISQFVVGLSNSDEFYEDEKTFDAVLMNFINIGESITKLSEKLKASEPGIPWAKYKGFRNIVAHNYFGVDAEEVWQIIHTSIPQLEAEAKIILSRD
jgi:uncharacterized protein with HEPN domain